MTYKTLLVAFAVFSLSACIDSDSDSDDQVNEALAEFEVYSADDNEFVDSVTPAHKSEVGSLDPVISITMTSAYGDGDVGDLQAEVYGFPKGENCVIEGDGFRCNGEYPIVLSDLEGNLPDNTWHSTPGVSTISSQANADYEIILTDAGVNALTVTFTLQNGAQLSADKQYVVHVYGGPVQYSFQENDDTMDFKTYWLFSTAQP